MSMAARPPVSSQRLRALALYKELHRLGRDYEASYDFHGKLRKLYEKNCHLTDEAEIEKAIQFGEYIKNETLALYSLRKYRHLKRMYPSGSDKPDESRLPPELSSSTGSSSGSSPSSFPVMGS